MPPATFTATLSVVSRVSLAQPQFLPNGDLKILLQGGIINASYLIENSTNLLDWVPLTTVTYTNDPTAFTDSATGPRPQRFYRARNPP